jgi:endonuclease/exonuclease/phosphatase family metal-dependent hydrolase
VSESQPQRLRVLSYNIHHGEGVDGKLNLERIARVIRSVEPDLVAVQEVDKNTRRTGQVDQPAELARLTGMHVAFGANIKYQGGDYGNAVLSRFPIHRHENHLLPLLDEGEQRGVLIVEVVVPNEASPLVLMATHLDHRRDDKERLASADAINHLASKLEGRPALLAGDLNDTPDSPTLQRLAAHWTLANKKAMPTVPVDRPARQIDFILYRPAERWKVIATRVLDEAVASDHRAIFAELELRPQVQ